MYRNLSAALVSIVFAVSGLYSRAIGGCRC